jgi:hypothetical protein
VWSADESVRQAIVSRAVEQLSEPIVRPARIRGQAREASVAKPEASSAPLAMSEAIVPAAPA